ncbi:xaa-Pro aminopeptidase 3 isoform X2 [Ambystoma mexicanum]|uniref:xaa-Pro aminopeptidase 3 isoform X2 n=1 Tax=Ambystoma mexicanum TaxID=8296 RepID=UPI0037E8300E
MTTFRIRARCWGCRMRILFTTPRVMTDGTVTGPRRTICLNPALMKKLPNRYLGQPSHFTHPHRLAPGDVTPGLTQIEYALRRHKLMSLIQKEAVGVETEHAVILLSNPTFYMTNDIPFPFHQDTNFLYLSGFQEPDSILLLQSLPGRALPAHKAILFVPKRDQRRELWDGPRSGTDGATALTGVDESYSTEEFKHYLPKLQDESVTLWYDSVNPSHPGLHWGLLHPLVESRAKSRNKVRSIRHLIQNLRLVKSKAEVELMKIAGKISSQAFIETIFASRAPVDESFLYAKFDFECRARGADILAYPPVVAGGNRSNTLHYVKNNQQVKDGEMVLLDGGCEASCYVSDITRTWPVNGRYSVPQAQLYQAVLEVQKACLSLCYTGMSLDNIYSQMMTLIGQKLQELGILPANCSDGQLFKEVRRFCPHHVGHFLGMDVHDTPEMSRSIPLRPGMVITVEPGIYIAEDDPVAPDCFRGLGVRIEDDVLITDDAPLVLSAHCPKEIYDIEQICTRRPGA